MQNGIDQAVGAGDGIAGVFDHRGEGPVGHRLAVREAHRGGQAHAVTHGEVVQPDVQGLAGVEPSRRNISGGKDPEPSGGRLLAGQDGPERVPGTGGHVADNEASERIGAARAHRVARGISKGHRLPGGGTGDIGLADRSVPGEGSCRRGGGQGGGGGGSRATDGHRHACEHDADRDEDRNRSTTVHRTPRELDDRCDQAPR